MIGAISRRLERILFVVGIGGLMVISHGAHAVTYKLSIQACGGGDKPVELLLAPASRFDSLRVTGLTVMSEGGEQESDGGIVWQISADPVISETGEISSGVALRKIIYGTVPEGFSVIHEAVHLECDKNYVVTVSAAGHIGQLAFTPGEAACPARDQNPSGH